MAFYCSLYKKFRCEEEEEEDVPLVYNLFIKAIYTSNIISQIIFGFVDHKFNVFGILLFDID